MEKKSNQKNNKYGLARMRARTHRELKIICASDGVAMIDLVTEIADDYIANRSTGFGGVKNDKR